MDTIERRSNKPGPKDAKTKLDQYFGPEEFFRERDRVPLESPYRGSFSATYFVPILRPVPRLRLLKGEFLNNPYKEPND